jgi:ParB-like chromosome segregation protein Spo0J
MEISRVSIDLLLNDPSNARLHDKENLAAIKGSLAKFGQQKPIVITKEGVVVAGNGTLMAARELGWTALNVVYTELSSTEAIAFAIADNRTAELGTWNKDVLGKQLLGLSREGFGIADIGFDPKKWIRSGSDDSVLSNEIEFKPKLPSDEEKEKKDKKLTLVVECKSVEDLEDLFSELNERGFKVKI